MRESLTSHRSIIWAVLGYALAAVAVTVYSVTNVDSTAGRFTGLFGNANSFGHFLSYAIPVLTAAFFAGRGFLLRAVCLGSSALGFVSLLLSGSRASMMSLVVQGIVMCVLFRRVKLIVISGLLFLAVATTLLLTPSVREVIFTVLRLQSGTTHRTVIWNAGIEGALKSPIVGHGFGLRVGEVVPAVDWGNWEQAFVFKSQDAPFYAHNLYIHLILSSGLPGLVLFGMVAWTLWRRHLNAGRAAATRGLRIANYTIVAMICGALANSVFEAAALIGKGAINNYFWIAVGIVAAYERIEQRTADLNQ